MARVTRNFCIVRGYPKGFFLPPRTLLKAGFYDQAATGSRLILQALEFLKTCTSSACSAEASEMANSAVKSTRGMPQISTVGADNREKVIAIRDGFASELEEGQHNGSSDVRVQNERHHQALDFIRRHVIEDGHLPTPGRVRREVGGSWGTWKNLLAELALKREELAQKSPGSMLAAINLEGIQLLQEAAANEAKVSSQAGTTRNSPDTDGQMIGETNRGLKKAFQVKTGNENELILSSQNKSAGERDQDVAGSNVDVLPIDVSTVSDSNLLDDGQPIQMRSTVQVSALDVLPENDHSPIGLSDLSSVNADSSALNMLKVSSEDVAYPGIGMVTCEDEGEEKPVMGVVSMSEILTSDVERNLSALPDNNLPNSSSVSMSSTGVQQLEGDPEIAALDFPADSMPARSAPKLIKGKNQGKPEVSQSSSSLPDATPKTCQESSRTDVSDAYGVDITNLPNFYGHKELFHAFQDCGEVVAAIAHRPMAGRPGVSGTVYFKDVGGALACMKHVSSGLRLQGRALKADPEREKKKFLYGGVVPSKLKPEVAFRNRQEYQSPFKPESLQQEGTKAQRHMESDASASRRWRREVGLDAFAKVEDSEIIGPGVVLEGVPIVAVPYVKNKLQSCGQILLWQVVEDRDFSRVTAFFESQEICDRALRLGSLYVRGFEPVPIFRASGISHNLVVVRLYREDRSVANENEIRALCYSIGPLISLERRSKHCWELHFGPAVLANAAVEKFNKHRGWIAALSYRLKPAFHLQLQEFTGANAVGKKVAQAKLRNIELALERLQLDIADMKEVFELM